MNDNILTVNIADNLALADTSAVNHGVNEQGGFIYNIVPFSLFF